MAEGDDDKEQKTEQPTSKRLEEAYKKGNVPFSREVGHFMIMLMIAATVAYFAPDMMRRSAGMLIPFLESNYQMPVDEDGVALLLKKLLFGSLGILALPSIGAMALLIASALAQNGVVLTSEPIQPQLSRISLMEGVKRLFSVRSVVELVKSLIKIGVVGYACYAVVMPELPHLQQLPGSTTAAMMIYLAMLAGKMTVAAALVMFFVAVLDLLYQRFQFTRSLRMTKQEIKDEYKQSEGDPHIKQRLRRIRMEKARSRMMANVPKADVVITNPTHFAVALQYDSQAMKAPLVLAKGQDLVALKIREVAATYNIPIVENPPLARALFDSTDIEQEIPAKHYEAVAKVISYVYQLKGRRA
jgi:flagellar biosynthetic protein FlhB